MSNIPVYIRFGQIPSNEQSKIFFGDQVVGLEPGVSVYETVYANNKYFPILPKNTNENGISDYFDFLLNSDKPIYLVVGDRIRCEGHGGEPLLQNVKIIKQIFF